MYLLLLFKAPTTFKTVTIERSKAEWDFKTITIERSEAEWDRPSQSPSRPDPTQSSPLWSDTLIAVTVSHQCTHCHCRQPSTHYSLPSPSTINALIAVAINYRHTHWIFRQPLSHSLPLPPTIDALIAVAGNHQGTHCRRRQPSMHSSLSNTEQYNAHNYYTLTIQNNMYYVHNNFWYRMDSIIRIYLPALTKLLL